MIFSFLSQTRLIVLIIYVLLSQHRDQFQMPLMAYEGLGPRTKGISTQRRQML